MNWTLKALYRKNNVPCCNVWKVARYKTYEPGGDPKVKSRIGAAYGLVIPWDIWQETAPNRTTLICAGEKDMAVARSYGFNAITLTGGEATLPFSPAWFRDRDVVILYDNDNTGKVGAHKLASYLIDYCHTVKVCTEFHKVCKEDKEDLTDFFNKYHGTKEQLIEFMDKTPVYTKEDCVQHSTIPSFITRSTTLIILIKLYDNIQVAA